MKRKRTDDELLNGWWRKEENHRAKSKWNEFSFQGDLLDSLGMFLLLLLALYLVVETPVCRQQ